MPPGLIAAETMATAETAGDILESMDPKPEDREKPIPTIRTLQSDAELYIKNKNLSPLEIAARAYTGQRREAAAPPQPSNRKFLLLAGAGATVVLLVGGVVYFLIFSKSQAPIAQEAPTPAAFLKTEDVKIITADPVNPGALLQTLNRERTQTSRSGGALIYYPVKIKQGYADAKDFLALMKWNPPQAFIDALDPVSNAFIYFGEQSKDFAVLLKTTSFNDAFSSLLAWEKTMPADWLPLLAPGTDLAALPRTFQDEVIRNNDARVLKNADGSVIVGYAIFNKKFIVMATSRDALSAILMRLIALPPQ